MNRLEEDTAALVPVDYGPLLKSVLSALQGPKKPLFELTEKGNLTVNVDALAQQVVALAQRPSVVATAPGLNAATINFADTAVRDAFVGQVTRVRDRVSELLQETLPTGSAPREALVQDLKTFVGRSSTLGLDYPLNVPFTNLEKQQLTVRRPASVQPALKFHRVAITVRDVGRFDEDLVVGLRNHARLGFSDAQQADLAELEQMLDDPNTYARDVERLKALVSNELVGRLKREAMLRYLEFLGQGVSDATPGGQYLRSLLARLRGLEAYVANPARADGDFTIAFRHQQVNFRDLFSRADAFDAVPIIPIVEGTLGQSTNDGSLESRFVFGMKLKLNGPVAARGKRTTYEYYLDLIDPRSAEYKRMAGTSTRHAERALQIALLYFVVFDRFGDLDHDPIAEFERRWLPRLRKGPDDEIEQVLGEVVDALRRQAIAPTLVQLKALLRNRTRTISAEKASYPLHVRVRSGILERDLDAVLREGRLFKDELRANPRAALKYLAIDPEQVESSALVKLAARIDIEAVYYYPTDAHERFSMAYDLADWRVLPVLMVPILRDAEARKHLRPRLERYLSHHVVVMPYAGDDLATQPARFAYRFVYTLLSYVCLSLLVEAARPAARARLFVPIVRLHRSGKENPPPMERFIRGLGKSLAHLFGQECRASSQGFNVSDGVRDTDLRYTTQNGLSSLYSVLPKTFRVPADTSAVERLAIVAVSSRKCDAVYRGAREIVNLVGEAVGITRDAEGGVRVEALGTFSANYEDRDLYREPTALVDLVTRLFREGYRHVVYVAKSPYSSSLPLARGQVDEELFFMSKDIIKRLKECGLDLKVYPVYCDKYYALKLAGIKAKALYIQDTIELTAVLDDLNKKLVVFFNLFNGITVGNAEDGTRNYNGVVSYATPLNIYEGILDDQDIRMALLYDGRGNSLKNAILEYLTLFHFSRYERDRDISLKLDPYKGIIGDDSVSRICLFDHATGRGQFHALAFLTEVRRALGRAR